MGICFSTEAHIFFSLTGVIGGGVILGAIMGTLLAFVLE